MSQGPPFLLYRDDDGAERLLELSPAVDHVAIGRRHTCELALPWDGEVSRVHAELVRMGSEWVVQDDGLSHNGTFVNGSRVRGRRRLRPDDVIRVGSSLIMVCAPEAHSTATRAAGASTRGVALTPAQRRLLVALCRPLRESGLATTRSNRELAAELVLSLDTVKGTLTALFELFGLAALPQNQKRTMLAVRAIRLVGAE